MTHVIEVKGLTKRYRETLAVDDVTFTIEKDTIYGLLGRNGAGKTTVMSILTAQNFPTHGEVRVFGENPYAEFQGDLKVQTLPGSMTQHLEIMKKLQDEQIPVVAILFSGRPLWQNRELNLANAYVAAWLPVFPPVPSRRGMKKVSAIAVSSNPL